jgi:hypothetical protein
MKWLVGLVVAVFLVLSAVTLYMPTPAPSVDLDEQLVVGWWCYSGDAIPDPHRPGWSGMTNRVLATS